MQSTCNPVLAQRTASGVLWLLAARFGRHGLNLAQAAILAHFLEPHDFGVAGVANLATYAAGLFVYMGFEEALIQRRVLSERDLNTGWWVILGRYAAIALALLAAAKPVADFFKTPEAAPLLAVFALGQLTHGFLSPGVILLQRELRFSRIFILDASSGLGGLAVGATAAVLLRDAWALALGYLATEVITVMVSYLLYPYRPRAIFDRRTAAQFVNYGQWVLGSRILWFASSQGPSVFAGRFLGASSLGLFQMSNRFASLPVSQVSDSLQSALTPACAAVQDDPARLRLGFLRAFRLASLAMVIITALMAFVAPPLVGALLGSQWNASAQLLPGLAAASGLQALLRTGAPLYLGTGHPRWQFWVDLVQAAVMTVCLLPAASLFGLGGLPLAICAGALAAAPVWWAGVRRCCAVTLREIGLALGPPVLAAAAMGGVVFLGQTGPGAGLLAGLAVLAACAWRMPGQWGFGEIGSLLKAYSATLRQAD